MKQVIKQPLFIAIVTILKLQKYDEINTQFKKNFLFSKQVTPICTFFNAHTCSHFVICDEYLWPCPQFVSPFRYSETDAICIITVFNASGETTIFCLQPKDFTSSTTNETITIAKSRTVFYLSSNIVSLVSAYRSDQTLLLFEKKVISKQRTERKQPEQTEEGEKTLITPDMKSKLTLK